MNGNKVLLYGTFGILIIGLLVFWNLIGSGRDQEAIVNETLNSISTLGTNEYNGLTLAGTKSKYISFTNADYLKAKIEGKKILLYFYASWCPLCKEEQPKTFAAFNELDDENIIGFRVNYKDNFTDEDEEKLAKELGITYQHTKVIIQNEQILIKSLESWDKDRYILELTK